VGAAARLEAIVLTALRLAGIAVLAALAILAALLAADVRAWPVALDRGDAVYAIAPGRAQWTPPARLGGLAETLVGTAEDVAARRALQAYRGVAGLQEQLNDALGVQTQQVAAINLLAAPASSADSQVAAQARTLLGILAFTESAEGGGVSQTDTAIADFTDAVRVEPGDTAAKFDLELLLGLSAAHGQRHGAGLANGFGRTGQLGASGGVPGSGF
jgi:hypothetical protein